MSETAAAGGRQRLLESAVLVKACRSGAGIEPGTLQSAR